MKKYRFKLTGRRLVRLDRKLTELPTLLFLILCFLMGSVLGCFVGSGAVSGAEAITQLLSEDGIRSVIGYLHCLWTVGWYHLVVLLAATSLLGVFIIPATVFLRGYFLSCTAAATIAVLPEHGIITALIGCGISAVLTMPSLLLLSMDGYSLSKRLRALSMGRSSQYGNGNVLYHIGITAACLFTAAAADYALVPWLLSHLF